MNTRRITSLAIFLSISIVLSIVESFIPSFSIPGAKLGLANIITLVIMYSYGEKDAFVVLILRILIVALLRSGFFSPAFYLSLSGGMLAYLLMFTFKNLKVFNIISVSVMGSLGHSLGQIIAAIIILDTAELVYYFPFLFIIAIPTGFFVGYTSRRFLNIVKENIGVTEKYT